MTYQEFISFYPQFTDFPPMNVKQEYIRLANARFEDFEEDTEEARRLYVAHKLTMYAMIYPSSSTSGGGAAAASAIVAAGIGTSARLISSKKVDDVQVTYSYGKSSSSGSSSSGQEDLRETTFGQQLLSLLRLNARSCYVP